MQQEYRDILQRQMPGQEGDGEAVGTPGPFDEALARFKERKETAGDPGTTIESDKSLSALSVDETIAKPVLQISDKNRLYDEPAEVRIAQNSISNKESEIPARVPGTPLLLDGVDRVVELQNKIAKVRRGTIQQKLKDQLNYAAQKTGLQVEVYSGGQPAVGLRGIDREGGPRHDNGAAADLKLFEVVNGQKRHLSSDDPKTSQECMRLSDTQ